MVYSSQYIIIMINCMKDSDLGYGVKVIIRHGAFQVKIILQNMVFFLQQKTLQLQKSQSIPSSCDGMHLH